MLRRTSFLIGFLISLTLVAVTAASAAASEFVVEENGVTSAVSVEGTSGVSKLKASGITIECKKDTASGKLEEGGASTLEIKTSECSVPEPTHCALKEAIAFKSKGALAHEPIEDELKPGSGSVFAEITIQESGGSCSAAGTYKLEGTQTCELPNGRALSLEHEVVCTTSGSKLTLGGKTATLESTETLELTSGEWWGVTSPTIYLDSYNGEYPEKFTASDSKLKILEAGKDTVTCGKVEFSGELAASSSAVVVTPTYSECKADIAGSEATAKVTPGSCKYEVSDLQEGSEVEGEVLEQTRKAAIEPSGCGHITIEDASAKCTFEVPAQGPFTGTTVKPDGEAGIEVTAEDKEATVTAKSCSESKSPFHIWLIVSGVWHFVDELIHAHFSFYLVGVAGGPWGNIGFNAGETREIEVRNEEREWPLLAIEALVTIRPQLWEAFTAAGVTCWGNRTWFVYLPHETCRFKIKAPATSPSNGVFYLEGRWFRRGRVTLYVP